MQRLLLTMAGALMLAMTGCGSPCRRPCQRDMEFGPAPRAELASALLFDRVPGRYPAEAFAFRSEWPSTDSFYSTGQIIFFSERFIDYQGNGFNPDYTYRRFDTFRAGVGYR